MKRIWVLETDGEIEEKSNPFFTPGAIGVSSNSLDGLPRGIIQATSDLELKPLWSTSDSKSKVKVPISRNLLAIPVGIKQKRNVDAIVQKFLADRFTIMLLHYDANVDGWFDLEWSKKAIHIVAPNQTKWWFAKRFLHPDVVSIYDYIFLWDEDLGVENFHPGRYLKIVKSERLEISQPALDQNSTGIHHKITVRKKGKKFHTRILDAKGRSNCSVDSEGPPCTGQVIYMWKEWLQYFRDLLGLVFGILYSLAYRAASIFWQNDLVHGWGMDIKLGYCAQGGRIENIGVVDSEYVLHQGIKSLGGAAAETPSNPEMSTKKPTVDVRTEVRRESTLELKKFRERWDQAVKEDKNWVDPFRRKRLNR
ncbi:hypothetical protein RHSIM_Rhsim13G0175300 [Rhododendron simsii]|uniref:Uncharacterized protein n=1 Tax=Rhododendron simsii TaxID=118357 RepID=A0A834L5H4_RHOSS|nr:hypothetical protein RHSIM_Rhsim13G0175300 [Rhododendron simsii]